MISTITFTHSQTSYIYVLICGAGIQWSHVHNCLHSEFGGVYSALVIHQPTTRLTVRPTTA